MKVKVYAYRYLEYLNTRKKTDYKHTTNGVEDSDGCVWSKEESAVLFTVIAATMMENNALKNKRMTSFENEKLTWEKIAAMIPGKTAAQCYKRYIDEV